MQVKNDKIWEPLKTRGLHFCHLSVNSLLSKIDELRDIINYVKPASLGIAESKLDSSVTNTEVNINGYSLIRNDRNRNIFSVSIKYVFFEILVPKVKPIAIEIFYRPQGANDFLNAFSNNFQQSDNKTKMKFIFPDTLISTYFKMEILLKKKISHLNLKMPFLP